MSTARSGDLWTPPHRPYVGCMLQARRRPSPALPVCFLRELNRRRRGRPQFRREKPDPHRGGVFCECLTLHRTLPSVRSARIDTSARVSWRIFIRSWQAAAAVPPAFRDFRLNPTVRNSFVPPLNPSSCNFSPVIVFYPPKSLVERVPKTTALSTSFLGRIRHYPSQYSPRAQNQTFAPITAVFKSSATRIESSKSLGHAVHVRDAPAGNFPFRKRIRKFRILPRAVLAAIRQT